MLLRAATRALLAVILASRANTSYACSCAPALDALPALEKSDAVFLGVVQAIEPIPIGLHPEWLMSQGVVVKFSVLTRWKGSQRDTTFIATGNGGSDCGFPFVRGAAYLIYANGKQDTMFTSRCARTRIAAVAAADLQALGKPRFDRRKGVSLEEFENVSHCTLHPSQVLEDSYGQEIDTVARRPTRGYVAARDKSFPLSHRWIFKKGVLHPDIAVLACPECRYEETIWCRDHGGCFGWTPQPGVRLR